MIIKQQHFISAIDKVGAQLETSAKELTVGEHFPRLSL